MLVNPQPGMSKVVDLNPTDPANLGAIVNTTINETKGAWSQLIASTAEDAFGIGLMFHGGQSAGSATPAIADVGIGGSGDEKVILRDLNVGWQPFWNNAPRIGAFYYFPIWIKSGSRLAARMSGVGPLRAACWLLGKPRNFAGFVGSKVTTYGPQGATIDDAPANHRGTVVTASVSAYGTAGELVASTSDPIRYLQVGIGGAGDTTLGNNPNYFKVLAGGVDLIEHLPYSATTQECLDFSWANALLSQCAFNVPAGVSLSISVNAGLNADAHDFFLYGVS